MRRMEDTAQYGASERSGQIVSSILIGYRLTIGAPVETMLGRIRLKEMEMDCGRRPGLRWVQVLLQANPG